MMLKMKDENVGGKEREDKKNESLKRISFLINEVGENEWYRDGLNLWLGWIFIVMVMVMVLVLWVVIF